MENPLIIGGDGTVARALIGKLEKAGQTPHFTTRRTGKDGILLDLSTSPNNWLDLPEARVVFLCAAIAKLDACEDDPAGSHRVNVEGMKVVTERVQAKGGFVIFLSSNQVFDGSKPYRRADEETCPLNEYGRQKAEFEGWLLSRPQPAAVLRLTKVIDGALPIFTSWEEKLKRGEAVQAFEDLRFAPVPLSSVVEGLIDLGQRKAGGVYHLSGLSDISYYELAQAMASSLGVKESLVTASRAGEGTIRSQFLPKHGTLDNTSMAHIAVPEPVDCFDRSFRSPTVLLRNSAAS